MNQKQLHLKDYFKVILRRRWIIITFSVVLVVTILIISLQQTPIYEATATIMINRSSPRVISIQEVSPMGTSGFYADRDYYETQYRLIKSYSILKKVARSLGFDANNPHKSPYSVKKLKKIINIKPLKNSQLVAVNVEGINPLIVAKIVNAVIKEYINENLDRNLNATKNAWQWLSKKIEEQRKKLRDSEITLQKYRKKYKIRILPLLSGEGAVEDIKVEYARLQAMLAKYLQRYTNKHPKVIEIKAQIDSLRYKIQGLGDSKTGATTMEYRALEQEVQSNKQMYEILLTRLKEVDLSRTLNVNNVTIIDQAEVPDKPIKPRILLNTMLAVIAGLIGGIVLGFFVDYMDTTIKSPEDIEDILDSHFLEAIPVINNKDDIEKYKLMQTESSSPIAEAYRSLRTSIFNSIPENEVMKTYLVTSAEPGAGKTITVTNLSIALAQEGNNVLLVDCDFRKPRQHMIFSLDRDQGLSEYLQGSVKVDNIFRDTDIDNLKIITSGRISSNSSELIGFKKLDELISSLIDRFDFVFFDSPPISRVTDSIVLANKVDASILVIRSGKSHVSLVVRAMEQLAQSKAKIAGVVLNGLQHYHSNYHYYRYDGYYMDESLKEKKQKNLFFNNKNIS